MGWKNTSPIPLPADRDVNPYWKWQLGWLPDANIATPAVSGTYRIHAFDQPTLEAGKDYALRIVRDPSRVYWFSYRQSITNTESIWSANGLEVRIGGESVPATGGHTALLDMTPGSRGLASAPGLTNSPYATLYDAPLAIGRTYSDQEANLHVTPVKKGGTTPESLDVVLNYGPFPGNVAPAVSIAPATVTITAGVAQTFTATASDANGDALSYYWEFDDPDAPGGSAAGNTNLDARLSTQGSHAWTRDGTHFVRCTVTDMKGGKTIASATVTVTGGTTALRTISGVVKDEDGNPLAGAVVNNYKGANPNFVRYGATNFVGSSETAADGKYVVQVPAGVTGTFYLNVLHQGFSFTSPVANAAVAISSSSVANVDFARVRTNRNVSGGVYVAGRGYNPATDGTLTVNVNGQNIGATNGNWTTTVADGTPLNVTATSGMAGNSVFGTFPNPYVAVDDFNLLHLFLNVAGQMPQVGFAASSASSDDTVGTVNIPVTLALPPGSNSWPANQGIYFWIDPSSTAEYGVDYKATGGGTTFYGGQTPTPYLIPLKLLPTGQPKSKTVVFKLGPATSIVNMGPITTFTYTITNAPVPPPSAGTIQFAQSAYSVGEAAGTVTLVATRTGGSSSNVTGYYRTADGTATAGQDYAPTTNAVSWSNGDTAPKNVVITILNDTAVEPNETFTVTFFTTFGGATLGALATATVTINDDDTVPPSAGAIQFAQANYSVGEADGTVTLVATRTDGASGTVSAYYRTADGTATDGQDYSPTTNAVTWTDGDTAPKNIVITILNDTAVETNETFYVSLFTTTGGATLGPRANAVVTILDDDSVGSPENHPPVLPGSTVITIQKPSELVYTNTAMDIDLPAQTLTYQLLVSPGGATIDANGIVRWTPPAASTNYFQVKVTDNGSPALSATNSFYVIVHDPPVPENHVPVLPRPTVVNVVKLTEMVFTNTAVDIDLPVQTLAYELLAMPAGATIDANGIIRWTPSLTQGSSTNRFRTKVTDSGSPPKSATNVFYAIVTEGNTAPILFGRSLLALTNAALSETYTAADSDTPANTLSFNLVSGPVWLAFTKTGEKSAQLAGTPPVVTTEAHLTAVLQVTDNGTPPLSNRLTVNLTLLPPPIIPSFVTRHLPAGYVPGTTLTVTLQANPPIGTTTYAVTDTPPATWVVGTISHGGQMDPVIGQVKFGFFNDATARTLTYEVTPPVAETGLKSFFGVTSKDAAIAGVSGDATLNQMRSHPADSSPTDLQITTAELAAYAAAWQNGSPWPTAPNPIEVSFVTRAGFLVQRGGTYTVNPLAPLPLAWIPNSQVSMMLKIATDIGVIPTGKGCWRFLPPKLAVGAPTTVTIILNPGATDACHAVEEIPPAGWAVTNISHAGIYDAASGRVRWGLFTDQTSRTLTYDVIPTGALAPFAGVVSFDGTTAPTAGASEPQIVPAVAEPEFAPVIRLPSGEMVLPLSTRFGAITVIEFSDDLKTWTPVWTNSPGSQLFRDLPQNLPPGRYYRSIEQ